jgi:hypothetical protein
MGDGPADLSLQREHLIGTDHHAVGPARADRLRLGVGEHFGNPPG